MQRSNVMTTDRSRQSLTMRMRMMLMMMLMMMMLMAPQGVQAQSTCTAVEDMNSRMTYVTCHFEQRISKDDFNVQFFSSDGSTQETALACNHQESDSLNCHKANGVEFDEHQKKPYHLTFARNAALSPAGSKYQCQRVPSVAEETAEKCTVGEIDIPEAPEPTTPKADTEGSGASAAVSILLVIVIIIVVAVGICCALAYVKRDRISKWVTLNTIGQLGPEDLKDPEKPISRDPKMPEGWPVFFFNMGWREAEKGEENKDKGTTSSQTGDQSRDRRTAPVQESAARGDTAALPLLPSQQQRQSKDAKQDPGRDDDLAEHPAVVQPLLPARSVSPPTTTPQTAQPPKKKSGLFSWWGGGDKDGSAVDGRSASQTDRNTTPPQVRRSNSCYEPKKARSHAGRRPASLHDVIEERAGQSGESTHEPEPPQGDDTDDFHDAQEGTSSPGEEASITPGKKETKKEREAREKAEKERVKKENKKQKRQYTTLKVQLNG